MVWWQWLISLICGLAGTALGGYISYKTMLAQQDKQREIENDRHIKQKREDLYIKACAVLMEHDKYRRDHEWPDCCKVMYNELQGAMLIYSSRQIYKKYYELDSEICQCYDKMKSRKEINKKSDEIADKIEDFAKDMRKELGIKGA